MLESIVLGIIQGISEWLPVSSEGLLFLVKTNFFKEANLDQVLRQVLFLHLGTFFAALIYLRNDIRKLFQAFINRKKSSYEDQKIINFLVWTTLVSGLVGGLLIQLLSEISQGLELTGRLINLIIGILLLITAFIQLRSSKNGGKYPVDLQKKDGWILGLMQGLAVLPGLSRSGLTVSGLLLRKFNEYYALRLSFLMSLPIVLVGNIILNFHSLIFSFQNLVGLVFSFIFGFLTIDILLKIAKKVNFGYFVLFFAILLLFFSFF